MDNFVCDFLIFTVAGFTAKVWLKSKILKNLIKRYRQSIFKRETNTSLVDDWASLLIKILYSVLFIHFKT